MRHRDTVVAWSPAPPDGEGPSFGVFLSRVSGDFRVWSPPWAVPPWILFSLVRTGRLSQEAVRENSLLPWWAPCVPPCPLAVGIVIVLVTLSERPDNIGRTDNHDAIRFAGRDSAGSQCLGEVLERPVGVLVGVQLGEAT